MKMVMKKSGKKGFTLAELLIVVAIIGVLVGISIPIFTTQLQKSRVATNQANARAAKAAAVSAVLGEDITFDATSGLAYFNYDVEKATGSIGSKTNTVSCGTDITGWDKDTAQCGSKVATGWTIEINKDGEVKGIYATFPA